MFEILLNSNAEPKYGEKWFMNIFTLSDDVFDCYFGSEKSIHISYHGKQYFLEEIIPIIFEQDNMKRVKI